MGSNGRQDGGLFRNDRPGAQGVDEAPGQDEACGVVLA